MSCRPSPQKRDQYGDGEHTQTPGESHQQIILNTASLRDPHALTERQKALTNIPHCPVEPPHIKTARRSHYCQGCISKCTRKSIKHTAVDPGARAYKDEDAFNNSAKRCIKDTPVKCAQ